MTDVNRKSTITDIAGKSWADLCDSSQSSQSQVDSPLKSTEVRSNDDDDLYDLVFQPIKKEAIQHASQDDLSLTSCINNVHMVTPVKQEYDKPTSQDDVSLTSFMNNVHMVTPVKQENDKPSTVIINEDTICSPFVKEESKNIAVNNTKVKSEKEIIEKKILNLKRDIVHIKRRLTSESGSTVSDPVTPERVNKVNKKSTEHRNIHDSVESPKIKLERETDPLILSRRQKQIDFGKNTIGYEKYLEQVPKHERKKEHPKTPPKNLKYTRRAWDGLVKNWRVRLHCWDPESMNDDDDALTTGSSSNLCSLGSITSLDSNSQASDSRPSTPPPPKRSFEDVTYQKREKHEFVSSPDPVKFKKYKTENL